MSQEVNKLIYTIAAEKLTSLIYLIEQTMEFMNEYQIDSDEEVEKSLIPLIEKMKKWIETK